MIKRHFSAEGHKQFTEIRITRFIQANIHHGPYVGHWWIGIGSLDIIGDGSNEIRVIRGKGA